MTDAPQPRELSAWVASVRNEAINDATRRCDAVKARFPGTEVFGAYDPKDPQCVWNYAVDSCRAEICDLLRAVALPEDK